MSARIGLGATSIVLNLIGMILNMLAFVLGLYLKHTTDIHKHFVSGSRYDIMISVIFAASIAMSLTNFLGIVVCSCALMTSGRGGCGSWLAMQMILLFLFAWLLLASGVLMLLETVRLETKLSLGLKASIGQYNVSLETKERVDRVQLEYQCCGSDNMSNWLTTEWINKSLVVNPNRIYLTGSEFVVNAVPFSCCNISAKTPCAHFPLPTFQEPTIYPAGCAAAVATSFRLMLCWYFGIGSIVAFFVTLILCVLVRSFFLANVAESERQERVALRAEKRALRLQGRQPLGQGRQPLGQGRQPLRQGRQPLRQARQPLRQARQPLRQARQPLLQPDFEEDDFEEEIEDEFDDGGYDDRRRPRRRRSRHSSRKRRHRSHGRRRHHRSNRRRYSSY
ncbi:hypothetical protein LSAT2_009961 [Lamellibrachia satsuma]|nr:hypothetical protein LSAT2_009961 [Lamellibrachia satsuma]